MGVFDKASLALVPDGIKDGKLYSVKPTDGSGDFTFERGFNLSATRVDENGLIEKGRENLLINSVWDGVSTDTKPTNWTSQFLSGTGTFDATSIEGQIRFTTSDSSGRCVILTPNITINGTLTLSVYVDVVYTQCQVIQILGRSANATAIAYYEDGIEVNFNHNVQAGKRYSIVFNKTADTTFRFGVGVSGGTLGDIVLSRPQLEQGLVATDYIETGATTAQAAILEDLPRIDYTGGTPSLLLEPSRTNLVEQSEYITNGTAITALNNDTQSPEGVVNATSLTLGVDGSATRHRKLFALSATSGEDYSFSVFFKEADAQWIQLLGNTPNGVFDSQTYVNFDLQNGVKGNVGTAVVDSGIEDYGNGWYRCYMVATAQTTETGYLEILTTNNTDSGRYPSYQNTTAINYCYMYGAQIEEGSYPTSYIPTYGAIATRGADSSTSGTISNVNEGVLFFEGSVLKNNNTIKLIEFNDGGLLNVIQLYYRDSVGTVPRVYAIAKEEGSQVYGTAYDIPSGRGEDTHKVAFRFEDNNFALFYNGTKVHSQTSGTILTNPKNQLMYGTSTGAIPFKGNIKQTLVFPEALSDAECITLTT